MRLPEPWVNVGIALLFPAVPVVGMLVGDPFLTTLATKAAILALAGVGLNLALGLGGMVSFGHAAFFGLGGYAAGILAHHAQTFTPMAFGPVEIPGTQSMPVIWLVAIGVAGLAALPIGMLSLRTKGVYFIMITLAFAQMIFFFAISWSAYGGEDGLPIWLRNGFPGLNTLDPLQFFGLCYGLLMLAVLLSWRLGESRFGLALKAVRQNPLRVTSVGMRPFDIQLTGFVISAMITGLAGALFADLNRFVSPSMLSWQTSGEIIIFIILGGIGRLYGPLAGAALFIGLEHALDGVSDYWQFFLGLMLLLVVLYARGGLIGLLTGRGARG